MLPSNEPSRWQVPDQAGLAVRFWGEECVVHGALSNDTLRLTGLAGRVLVALQQSGPVDLPSLVSECDADGEEIARALDALVQLDLVEPC